MTVTTVLLCAAKALVLYQWMIYKELDLVPHKYAPVWNDYKHYAFVFYVQWFTKYKCLSPSTYNLDDIKLY